MAAKGKQLLKFYHETYICLYASSLKGMMQNTRVFCNVYMYKISLLVSTYLFIFLINLYASIYLNYSNFILFQQRCHHQMKWIPI